MNAVAVARHIISEHGFRGFFHGCLPPLFGSAIYRGAMMSAYEFSFSLADLNLDSQNALKKEYFGKFNILSSC